MIPHGLVSGSQVKYAGDAATALAKMALPEKKPHIDFLASTRSGPGGSDEPSGVDQGQRERYANAISESVERLFEQLETSEKPGQLHGRIKSLSFTLARLDAHESLALILRAMELPGTWDGWTRADALDELLRHHARIPTDETLAILDPAIAHTISQGVHNQQNEYLLKRFLRIFAQVDDSARGVARIREVLSDVRFSGYRLRELVGALAESNSEEALDLLVELAVSPGNQFQSFAREWIAAVGSMALPKARALLLGLVDPDVTSPVTVPPGLHEVVAEQIVNAAATDAGTRDRILRLCELDVPSGRREILAGTVAGLGDTEAVLAGLRLIRDDASPAIPYQLSRAIEAVALEWRPYGDSKTTYTAVPRSAAALRARLMDLVLVDASRRHSAFSLLGKIEELRLEYGMPSDEPRHPAIDTGHPWPPLDLMS